jgi:hypothetical protein
MTPNDPLFNDDQIAMRMIAFASSEINGHPIDNPFRLTEYLLSSLRSQKTHLPSRLINRACEAPRARREKRRKAIQFLQRIQK